MITQSPIFIYALSAFLAAIPIIVWFSFIFKKTKRKFLQVALFVLNFFTVVPVFALQYILSLYPQFDIVHVAQNYIKDEKLIYVITFVCVGVVEELVKQLFIRTIDRKYLLIQTINESIKYSLIGALGFSFIENIFYLGMLISNGDLSQMISAYLFRSVFTTCAHLIFSGYFGYYYGIAKFTININAQSTFEGRKHRFSNFISHVFEGSPLQTLKRLTVLKGLLVAIILHATFNFLLEYNLIIYAVLIISIAFLFLLQLLKRKTGQMIMVTDLNNQCFSVMNARDEAVVIELIGMWFNQKKYVDVIHVCQRLLERDPENQVVKIFKAKAIDKIKEEDAYSRILRHIFPGKHTKG